MSYREEQVSYENKAAGVTLAGTLTFPSGKGKAPVVLLIAGMGPNDRDYTMLGHKLFLDLARHLAQQGIASMRYDKRGVGGSSGTFDTTLTSKDFASDALAGVQYLTTRDDVSTARIGLLGHSEGGMIAPMVALKSSDVSFLVLMAGVVATGIDENVEQAAMQLCADGATKQMLLFDGAMRKKVLTIIKQEENYDVAHSQVRKIIDQYLKELPEDQKKELGQLHFAISETNADDVIKMLNSPWYRYFLSYDPVETLGQIRIPVLAINGELDFVTSFRIAFPLIEQALKNSKNDDYTTIELPKHNHWLQACQSGALAEYGTIKETMSPVALEKISSWILEQVNS
ncbi:alpha/beta hydrolase family protein [Candidatus Dependentiae bacterium]